MSERIHSIEAFTTLLGPLQDFGQPTDRIMASPSTATQQDKDLDESDLLYKRLIGFKYPPDENPATPLASCPALSDPENRNHHAIKQRLGCIRQYLEEGDFTPHTERLWQEYERYLLKTVKRPIEVIDWSMLLIKEGNIIRHEDYGDCNKARVDQLTRVLMLLGRMRLYNRYGNFLAHKNRKAVDIAPRDMERFQQFCSDLDDALLGEEASVRFLGNRYLMFDFTPSLFDQDHYGILYQTCKRMGWGTRDGRKIISAYAHRDEKFHADVKFFVDRWRWASLGEGCYTDKRSLQRFFYSSERPEKKDFVRVMTKIKHDWLEIMGSDEKMGGIPNFHCKKIFCRALLAGVKGYHALLPFTIMEGCTQEQFDKEVEKALGDESC